MRADTGVLPEPYLTPSNNANRSSFRALPTELPTQYPTTLVAIAPNVPSNTFKTAYVDFAEPGGINTIKRSHRPAATRSSSSIISR